MALVLDGATGINRSKSEPRLPVDFHPHGDIGNMAAQILEAGSEAKLIQEEDAKWGQLRTDKRNITRVTEAAPLELLLAQDIPLRLLERHCLEQTAAFCVSILHGYC
jgi:hypothetical protein